MEPTLLFFDCLVFLWMEFSNVMHEKIQEDKLRITTRTLIVYLHKMMGSRARITVFRFTLRHTGFAAVDAFMMLIGCIAMPFMFYKFFHE